MAPKSPPAKIATHIKGFDHILRGGVPSGRSTLVVGGPGSGKTMLAMEFVLRGAARGHPGVFLSFDQSPDDLRGDFSSLGLEIEEMEAAGTLRLHRVDLDEEGLAEAGSFTLEGLLLQLEGLFDSAESPRIAIDSLESLFLRLRNTGALRSELIRLLRWLQRRGATAIITAESPAPTGADHGLEEFVTDCVIRLDHRVIEEISTRRARVLKYRGSEHSDDEHPFLIERRGISLIPVGASPLAHGAPSDRISTGVPGLDAMLAGEGYFRSASVLISGAAGTGKSSLAAAFVAAAGQRDERALYVAFEESPAQIIRNMASVGIELERWVDRGLLRIQSQRPSHLGLEQHLVQIERTLEDFEPRAVVVDPITNLIRVGTPATTLTMLTRLIDALKNRGITSLFTALGLVDEAAEAAGSGVSSLMDTWIEVVREHPEGEGARGLQIVKARGMDHTRGYTEFHLKSSGLELRRLDGGDGSGSAAQDGPQ